MALPAIATEVPGWIIKAEGLEGLKAERNPLAHRGPSSLFSLYQAVVATKSISTSAFFGRAATATVVRLGLWSPMYSE